MAIKYKGKGKTICPFDQNLLFESDSKLTLFVPYRILGYFITENHESCQNVHNWFARQIYNSKPLHSCGP